jgi:glycogen synthase
MTEDFSWDASMKEYVKLYKKVLELRKRHIHENPDPAFM